LGGSILQTPLGRPVRRRNDNIKKDLKRKWNGVDWIDLNENRENLAGNEIPVFIKWENL
jgi:hypothetical protein